MPRFEYLIYVLLINPAVALVPKAKRQEPSTWGNSSQSLTAASSSIVGSSSVLPGTGTAPAASSSFSTDFKYPELYPKSWGEPVMHLDGDNIIRPYWRGQECIDTMTAWVSEHYTVPMTITRPPTRWQEKEIWKGIIPQDDSANSLQTVMSNPTTTNPYSCCNRCWVAWDDVSVRYWPQPGSHTECLKDIKPEGSRLNVAIQNNMALDTRTAHNTGWINLKRDVPPPSLINKATKTSWLPLPTPEITPGPLLRRQNGTTNGTQLVTAVGSDGFVYTSPWIYLEIPRVNAPDACGYVGPLLTSVRISVEPERVSSIYPKNKDQAFCLYDSNGYAGDRCNDALAQDQFNFADLPCPPQSLRDMGGSYFIYNTDTPYNPLIAGAPITELNQLDPEYATCSLVIGWDPFIALQPQTALMENPTNGPIPEPTVNPTPGPAVTAQPQPTKLADNGPAHKPTPPQPASQPTPDKPAETPKADPPKQNTQPLPENTPAPAPNTPQPQQPTQNPSPTQQDPAPQPSNNPPAQQQPSNDPPAQQQPTNDSPAQQQPDQNQPATQPQQPQQPANPQPNNPAPSPNPTPAANPDRTFTTGGQTVVVNPSGTFVGGQKVTPGVATTINGAPISIPAPAQQPAPAPASPAAPTDQPANQPANQPATPHEPQFGNPAGSNPASAPAPADPAAANPATANPEGANTAPAAGQPSQEQHIGDAIAGPIQAAPGEGHTPATNSPGSSAGGTQDSGSSKPDGPQGAGSSGSNGAADAGTPPVIVIGGSTFAIPDATSTPAAGASGSPGSPESPGVNDSNGADGANDSNDGPATQPAPAFSTDVATSAVVSDGQTISIATQINVYYGTQTASLSTSNIAIIENGQSVGTTAQVYTYVGSEAVSVSTAVSDVVSNGQTVGKTTAEVTYLGGSALPTATGYKVDGTLVEVKPSATGAAGGNAGSGGSGNATSPTTGGSEDGEEDGAKSSASSKESGASSTSTSPAGESTDVAFVQLGGATSLQGEGGWWLWGLLLMGAWMGFM